MLGILLDLATLFLPWKTLEHTRFLVVLLAFLGAVAVLAALLGYWPGAVAALLLAAMMAGLFALARAAERREARRNVRGWRAD